MKSRKPKGRQNSEHKHTTVCNKRYTEHKIEQHQLQLNLVWTKVPRKVISSCSTSCIRRVTHIKTSVINHERGKNDGNCQR